MGSEQYREVATKLYDKYADRLRLLLARIQFELAQDYGTIPRLNLNLAEENEEVGVGNQFPFSSNLYDVSQVASTFYDYWLPDFIQNKKLKEEIFNLVGGFFSEIINYFMIKEYFELFPSDIMGGWKATDDFSIKGLLESDDNKSVGILIECNGTSQDIIRISYSISTMSKILYNFELIKHAQEQDKIL